MMHPLATPNNRTGACGLRAGDRVICSLDNRHGTADEFLHDGEALVSFDDGTYGEIKWRFLSKEVAAAINHNPGARKP